MLSCEGREAEAVSTSPVQTASPAWKQEVNRRLAEHKGRKNGPQAELHRPAEAPTAGSRRAQEAAARVAARYAKAPSYSEVLAQEARAALRAAEVAQQAALEATVAVQTILAGFEPAMSSQPAVREISAPQQDEFAALGPAGVELEAEDRLDAGMAGSFVEEDGFPETVALQPPVPVEPVSVRWATELPGRFADPMEFHASRGEGLFEEEWWKPASAEPVAPGAGEVEVVEPAQPIAGNIIEFPRELVAPRKARPRLAEAASAAVEPGAQLSIFEVDPALLPAEPEVETGAPSAETWTEPTWSRMELEAQPATEWETAVEEAIPAAAPTPELHAAPINRRLMAMLVDTALVSGGVLTAAITALHNARVIPGVHAAEVGLGTAVLMGTVLYYVLFFGFSRATPGMKYARLELITFEGEMPTRAQRCTRMLAMLLSVLPVGLGLVWYLFDDENLCWHDRLSRTYMRQG